MAKRRKKDNEFRKKVEQLKKKMMSVLWQNARHEAMESISDPDVPDELEYLAEKCQLMTGQQVTAIKKFTVTNLKPAGEIPDGNFPRWFASSISKKMGRTILAHPDDPEAIEERKDCWSFLILDDALAVEDWLRENGYPNATAITPTRVILNPPFSF